MSNVQTERDDRPLSAEEQRLLQRLLSDPTVYPQPLKTWLISYLETSDFSLPLGAVLGLRKQLTDLDHRLDAIPARFDEIAARLAVIEQRLDQLEAQP